jgi:hypothetical protein
VYNSSNFTVRGFAERKCDQFSNTGKCKLIWIKLAMIKVHCAMKKEGFLKQDDLTGARMIGF